MQELAVAAENATDLRDRGHRYRLSVCSEFDRSSQCDPPDHPTALADLLVSLDRLFFAHLCFQTVTTESPAQAAGTLDGWR